MLLKSICASVLLALLAACGSAPATPVTPPTAALLPTVTPTTAPVSAQQIPADTPQPISAPTEAAPTATPQPEATPTAKANLVAEGPQLIVPNANGLQAFSVDGTLVQTFEQAKVSLGRTLSDGIAPTGGTVAFISGDNPMTPDREGSGPLMLNLLDMHTDKQQPITPLFSPEMEHALSAAGNDRTDATEAGIAITFNDKTLAWSPDGRYLAFIAAIDGPSSDVYSYDRETGQINRLTDGPNQAANLFWSPDSKWIIHEEVEDFGTGAGWNVKAVWAAAPDGSGNRKLYDAPQSSGGEIFVDWVTPNTFLAYSWTVMGFQNIRLVNVDTGQAQRIGPDFPVQAMAYDPESQALLYMVDDFTAQQNHLDGGLYLAAPPKQPQFIAPDNWYDVRWLPHAQLFFAKGEQGVISATVDGTTQEYSGESALPIDAPDGAWLLAWGDGNFTSPIGLRLYTPDGELARQLSDDSINLATWSPDSDGVFYTSEGMLYYVAIPNGEPQLIAENAMASETGSLGWLMP